MMGDHRVLVVGKSADFVENLGALIDAFGHRADCIDDDAELRDKLRDERYRCVVTELDLNHGSVLNLIAELRAAGVWMPVVVVASSLSAADKERADELGVEVVLSEPPPVNWVWRLGNALSHCTRHASGFMRKVSPEAADDTETARVK